MPRIFISYAHESNDVKRMVRDFILELRRRGIDARLDQLEITMPNGGWPAWSSRQIVAADYVLLLCTQAYFDRFAGLAPAGSGLGVRYESSVIQNVQYFGKHRILF